MQDPKRQAWLYLVVGLLAVVFAVYFLSIDNAGQGQAGGFAILDWGLLGMGVVAVYRGVRGLRTLRRDAEKAANTPKVVLPRPKDPKPPAPSE